MGLVSRESKYEEESRLQRDRRENKGEIPGASQAGSHLLARHGKSRKSKTYRMKER